jgi:hypothetical protein
LPSPDEEPWVEDTMEEFTLFPAAPHDDRVDCASQALLWLHNKRPMFDAAFMAEIAQANRELGGMSALRAGEAEGFGGDDLSFSSYGSDPLTRKWSM